MPLQARLHPPRVVRRLVLVVLAVVPPGFVWSAVNTTPDAVRRLARILAAAYLRLLAARKAATGGQNRLDVARDNKASLRSRRRARG